MTEYSILNLIEAHRPSIASIFIVIFVHTLRALEPRHLALKRILKLMENGCTKIESLHLSRAAAEFLVN